MEEVPNERRQHSNEMGRRWDDRILPILRNIEALWREDIDTDLAIKQYLRDIANETAGINASLKIIAANFQGGDKVESQVMIFGAAKTK